MQDQMDQMHQVTAGVASDPGRLRTHNEDAYLVRPPFYAVADGLGGHAAGEVASRLAVQSLASALSAPSADQQALRAALTEANRVVYERSSAAGEGHGMGTTCVLLLLREDVAHLGHVGDSRIYQLRDNNLVQLTRDHTLRGEMMGQGLLTSEQAMSDGGGGALTRALGGGAQVDVDVQTVDVRPGDRFLLCSDGLTAMVADAGIKGILAETSDPQVAADRLVNAANAAGGEDNVTVIVVDRDGHMERHAS